MTALDAVQAAREQLAPLLGRPVESVSGVERDHGGWVVRAQVVELARIPNTTDVLGEYEALVDRNGEVVSYSRRGRYHRGQVDDQR
jgi:Gas vesicle synthesis protein GvpO